LKRLAAFSLVLLLLYHALGQVAAFWASEWQEDRALSENLTVYHSTDALVEFEIPVPLHQYGVETRDESGGEFEYEGTFYNIVRREVRNDTLHLYCYEDRDELNRRADLGDFIQKNVTGQTDAGKKSGSWLKNWVKDYAQFARVVAIFLFEDVRPVPQPTYAVANVPANFSLSSPPPEAV
jgi:hypothetical protein